MPQMTLQQAFGLALQHHQAGRLNEAEGLYRQILAAQPNHLAALLNLGVIAGQSGRTDLAIDLLRRATLAGPENPQAFSNLGNALLDQGNPAEAIIAYRRALALSPRSPEVHNNLANALQKDRQLDASIDAYRQAIALAPDFVEAYANLSNALQEAGKLEEAIAVCHVGLAVQTNSSGLQYCLGTALEKLGKLPEATAAFEKTVALQPDHLEAWLNLGNALCAQQRKEDAIAAYRRAIAVSPSDGRAYTNLGNVYLGNKEPAKAIALYRQALAHSPDLAEAHQALATALVACGQCEEAIGEFRRALQLKPLFPEALVGLAGALRTVGSGNEAIAAYRQAITQKPDYLAAYLGLGALLLERGQHAEALDVYRQALVADPKSAEAHLCMGSALKVVGYLDEAIAEFQEAIALRPDMTEARSNLIYSLCFQSDDAMEIKRAACEWNAQHARQFFAEVNPWHNNPDPERPLRIGYVSPNLRKHTNGFAMLPLLAAHDRSQYRITCYSDAKKHDSITDQCRAVVDHWHDTAQLSDDRLAELIRQDEIDILVDLTSHMANHRLLTFARKPAPVQTTYLCNQATTGLEAMDYRISDPHIDPPGHENHYTEQMIRLPECYLIFQPQGEEVPVNALPALDAGYVTFASLNTFCKVTPAVQDLWAKILLAVPGSRLILRCPPGEPQERVWKRFAGHGVERSRVSFCGQWLSDQDYLKLHHRVDIYLDPFPHSGHTTSMDALWMGVPLVTLAGHTAGGRGGVFLLANLQLESLIAETEQEYFDIAVKLAGDLPALSLIRSDLRRQLLASPLMDAPRFARNIESAYRQMWRAWCEGRAKGRQERA
jgi:predicted O-linked N-acetylglucosamine transferase (SPINDLY family)